MLAPRSRALLGTFRAVAFVTIAVPIAQVPARAQGTLAAPTLYRDSTRAVNDRVRDLLGRMTVDEKFWQMFMIPGDLDTASQDYSHGAFGLQISPRTGDGVGAAAARAHATRINDIQRYFVERTRLGIPIIPFEEALHGLVREGATIFPQAIALAATWDTSLMERVATAIASESGSRGIRQVLSPVINIASDQRWGRVEETYGEDPFLSSRMGVSFIRPFERAGIIATPKHLVANVGDGGRDSYPIDLSPRELDERYFPPFKDAVQLAGARSVMSAYNSVDGTPATQSRWLLTTKLRREWGFQGIVISDAAATGGATVLHMTEASTATAAQHAIEAGLDVIFQSTWEQHRPYLAAFKSGLISAEAIDSAVARVLRVKFELGLFEHPYVDPDRAATVNGAAEHRALSRAAAGASMVLLRNEKGTLPLRPAATIALIGSDAIEGRTGGYSGPGTGVVTIREGLQRRFGESRVRFAAGPGRGRDTIAVVPAVSIDGAAGSRGRASAGAVARVRAAGLLDVRGEYFDNITLAGTPRVVRTDRAVDFHWTLNAPAPGIPLDWYSVRWTGKLSVPMSGVRRIGVTGSDGYRLWIDGALVLDNWRKVSYGTRLVPVHLVPRSTHDVRLEFFETIGNARVQLVWDAGVHGEHEAQIAAAVSLVRQSDVAVVVAGIEEGEFRDRSSLTLPGYQEALIERIARTGKPVVVVLIGGSAIITTRWQEKVGAIVQAWYPGVEGGNAVADVLSGAVNPSGRLPFTVPVAEGQLPLVYNHKPTGRGDDYLDLTGQPLFPFGYGLSYTTFGYSDLRIEAGDVRNNVPARVMCRLTNTGQVAGNEVVQLYLRDRLTSVARPVMQLAAFRLVRLGPGEGVNLVFELPRERLQFLDESMRWVVEARTIRVMIGASSKDIRLSGDLRVP